MQKVPEQLLVRILQCLEPDTRLLMSCALVSSTWRTATVLAVRHISVGTNCTQHRATALSAWLATHAGQAQLTSIEAGLSERPEPPATLPELVLPARQLSHLQKLKLKHMDVSAICGSGAAAAAASLFGGPHGLTASLTHLELLACTASLQGLRSCTALRHLNIGIPASLADDPKHGSMVELLAADLPQLQQLIHLQLHKEAAADSVWVTAVSCLTQLQELYVQPDIFGKVASFNSLPSSLTRLSVKAQYWRDDEENVLSPSSTPGLVGLTALQDLALSYVNVDVALLAMLTQLSSLQLWSSALVTAPDGPTLRVLTALTGLRHLTLPPPREPSWGDPHPPVIRAAEDIAAISALQQLTCLELPGFSFEDGDEDGNVAALEPAFFQEGMQLPRLVQLTMDLLQFSRIATRVVCACPALQQLSLSVVHGLQPSGEIADLEELSCLSGLTSLSLDAKLDLDKDEWAALASLTGLHELDMRALAESCLSGSGYLTTLQQLTRLRLVWGPDDDWDEPEQQFEVCNTAPAGSASNLWSHVFPAFPSATAAAAEDSHELVASPGGCSSSEEPSWW